MKLSTILVAAIAAGFISSATYAEDGKDGKKDDGHKKAVFVVEQGHDNDSKEKVLIFHRVDANKVDLEHMKKGRSFSSDDATTGAR